MKSSGLGGQAVLEGVMMRSRSQYAVAVRKPDGEIAIEKREVKSKREKMLFFRLPVIRGVVAFIESLVLGLKTLTWSSEILEEEEEKSSEGEEDTGAFRETLENVFIVLLSVLLAVGLFLLLPFGVSTLLRGKIQSQTTLTLIEGAFKILLFFAYVVAISLLGDIRRVFMYHGAEHKSINCVENGLDLTVENVKKQSRYHKRCGTSFLFVVIFVSILFFLLIPDSNLWVEVICRILLIPVVAGVSFEFIAWAGNTDNPVAAFLSIPGMWFQKLTTKEPDEEMIEVAIASVEAVFDWKTYQTEYNAQAEREARRKKKASPARRTNKTKKTARQRRQELKEREARYKDKKNQRDLEQQEAIKKEEQRKKVYQAAKKRTAERLAATGELPKVQAGPKPAPKVEIDEDEDDLKGLDHYFDK
jgi:uncharacterized protein YqhQ